MAIEDQLQALASDKSAIRNAIIAKGGTCPESHGFDNFAGDIDSIVLPNPYTLFRTLCTDKMTEVIPEMFDPVFDNSIRDYAFAYCNRLVSVDLTGTNLHTFGISCFRNNVELTTIILPQTTLTIGNYCFYGNTAMLNLTVLANTPPSLGNSVFAGTSLDLVIYVPADSVDTYKSATGWSDKASQIQAIPTN